MNVNDININILIEHESVKTTPKKYHYITNFIMDGGAAPCQATNH